MAYQRGTAVAGRKLGKLETVERKALRRYVGVGRPLYRGAVNSALAEYKAADKELRSRAKYDADRRRELDELLASPDRRDQIQAIVSVGLEESRPHTRHEATAGKGKALRRLEGALATRATGEVAYKRLKRAGKKTRAKLSRIKAINPNWPREKM